MQTREQKNAYARAWRAANPEKVREYKRRASERRSPEQIERTRAVHRAWFEANPDAKVRYAKRARERYSHAKHIDETFALTREGYAEMFEAQGGVCAICKGVCRTGRRLSVDHCHETGRIRGLLCTSCNTALGHFEDDPEMLRRAAAYVEATCNSGPGRLPESN